MPSVPGQNEIRLYSKPPYGVTLLIAARGYIQVGEADAGPAQ